MNKIKYDLDLMKFMSLFESLTGAKVKDCIKNDKLIFVVHENEIGKAIGKKGINIRKIEGILKKSVKIVEYSDDVLQFIRNFINPLKIKDIAKEGSTITITGPDTQTKSLIIGRDRRNINHLKDITKRFFDIEEIKVV